MSGTRIRQDTGYKKDRISVQPDTGIRGASLMSFLFFVLVLQENNYFTFVTNNRKNLLEVIVFHFSMK